MALISPFRGVRYNPQKVSNIENVVTPPYDVIDQQNEAMLMAKDPYNMIRLDLGKKTSGAEENEQRYIACKDLLTEWEGDNVLIRDEQPSIYIYNIEYSHPTKGRLTRKGLVSLIGLAEFSEGIVKPHEKTFGGVITDRLRLLETCQTQFSQIFSFYSDPENMVNSSLAGACDEPPIYSMEDSDGCVHSFWKLDDLKVIAKIQDFFWGKSVYIADGHHRYTTALQMQKRCLEGNGELAEDNPFNFTMMYLCSMEDEGLTVLPTHRLAKLPENGELAGLLEKLKPVFSIEEIGGGSREVLIAETLSRMEEGAGDSVLLGFYHPSEDRSFLLTLKDGAMDDIFGDRHPLALRQLDVVVLSDLVIENCLGLSHDRCANENLVEYFSDPDEALDRAVKGTGNEVEGEPVLFLMNPTAVSQVQEVADEGLVMPHKSTYFYPKILTGLVMNKILPDESVCLKVGA